MAIRDGLDTAPDRLALEVAFGGAYVQAIQKLLDGFGESARGKVDDLFARRD